MQVLKQRKALLVISLVVAVAALALVMQAGIAEDVQSVVVVVSPSTLVLGSPGQDITMHAEIALSVVEASSVRLSGLAPNSVFADNRGELVAKFSRQAVEAIVAPPSAILELTGAKKDGGLFAGTDKLVVRNR